MIGYVFIAENLKTGKKYIGMNKSVKWDKNYFGQNEELQKDLNNIGPMNFTCTMLRACETVNELEAVYQAILKDHGAISDSNFYNCEVPVKTAVDEPKPAKKVSRKKKVEDE